jgi:hypothetical protein
VTVDLDILRDGFPAAEVKEHVHDTSIGPLWSYYSHWYFFSAGGRAYFAVRTWWDRPIIVSLREGKSAPDEKLMRQAANAAEREFALETLRAAAAVARKWSAKKIPEYSHQDKGPWDEVEGIRAEMHIAGRTKLKDAGPLLRELETIPSFDNSVWSGETVPAGGLFLNTCSYDPTRQQIQLALRRVGEKPAGYPVREVIRSRADAFGEEPYHPAKHSTPRSARVADITEDLRPQAVVDSIGEPDYVTRPTVRDGDADRVSEYDVDTDKPFTLRLVWSGQRMRAIEQVEPPAWIGDKRDLQD